MLKQIRNLNNERAQIEAEIQNWELKITTVKEQAEQLQQQYLDKQKRLTENSDRVRQQLTKQNEALKDRLNIQLENLRTEIK